MFLIYIQLPTEGFYSFSRQISFLKSSVIDPPFVFRNRNVDALAEIKTLHNKQTFFPLKYVTSELPTIDDSYCRRKTRTAAFCSRRSSNLFRICSNCLRKLQRSFYLTVDLWRPLSTPSFAHQEIVCFFTSPMMLKLELECDV